ncbi:MAG: glycosyltransferase [Pirellulales bacterium]
MTRRLCLIIPTLDRNGAEKQLVTLATGLPRERFDVHVYTLTRGGPLEAPLREAGIPVTNIGKRWKIDPAAYWRLRRHLTELQPDIVHTWLFAANSYGRAAARQAGVPHIVGGERCVDPWKRWHELAIDRRLARSSDAIITNSSGVRDFYSQRGVPAEKFRVIPNGIESRDESSAPVRGGETAASGERLAQLRLSELGLPSGGRVIGAVGRLWPQKRYQDLIWAIELLRWPYPDVQLVIVGDGPQRWRLERFARQVKMDDRVHFLGERDDVPQLMPLFDCFWLASGYEGQSNALMEAMRAGVPPIVSDIPGNRDLVEHDQSGLLVRVGDTAAYARAAKRLFDEPETARRLGAAARQRMLEEFSVERMIQRHVELYESL